MRPQRSAVLAAILSALCLLVLATAVAAPAVAQECEDCKIIKKGVPEATPGRATPTAKVATRTPTPVAVTPTVDSSPASPVVRAVLYWAEGCGHCEEVLDGVLPRLQQKYGPRLEVRRIEVLTLEDITGFFEVAEAYGFAKGEAEVPFLLIGERALMGVDQISGELPGLIETYLAEGGVDWPVPPAQDAESQTAAPADDGCDFAVPCDDEATVNPNEPADRAAPASGIPAPALAAGSAAVIVGGLAGALGVHAVRRRRAPLLKDDSLEHTTGENHAT